MTHDFDARCSVYRSHSADRSRLRHPRGNTQRISLPHGQKGIVAILATVSMIVIFGVAALAIDGGHIVWSKARLQNSLDAAALSAAKTLDDGGSQANATTAANNTFAATAAGAGNAEMDDAGVTLTVEFSTTLNPFTAGSTGNERFVRVTSSNFGMQAFFMPALGLSQKRTSGSAVAGPSPALDTVCESLAPMLVCGDPGASTQSTFFGYTPGNMEVLKLDSNTSDVGVGNFQLVRLPGNTGGSDIRDAMAGDYSSGCLGGGSMLEVDTEPGNKVGPSRQGLNHRFDIHQGPQPDYPFNQPDNYTDYPNPQLVYDDASGNITAGNNGAVINTAQDLYAEYGTDAYSYAGYKAAYAANPGYSEPSNDAKINRRIMKVPIANCSGLASGASTVPLLGIGCFFLTQPVETKGGGNGGGNNGGNIDDTGDSEVGGNNGGNNNGNNNGGGPDAWIIGEFVEGCKSSGSFDNTPNSSGVGSKVHRIILYKDVSRVDT